MYETDFIFGADSQSICGFFSAGTAMESVVDAPQEFETVGRAIELLNDVVAAPVSSSVQPASTLSLHDLKRYVAIRAYLVALQGGSRKLESSERVATELFPDKSPRHYGANIRQWATFYLRNLLLPVVLRGRHQKIRPLLCENDVQDLCRSFLRTLKPEEVGVLSLKRFLENDLFPGRTVSPRSCH